MRPNEALVKIAGTYLALITDEAVLLHVRALYASAARNADLGESFLTSGPEAVLAGLVRYLVASHRAGVLLVPDASLAAEQFAAMVRGNEQTRLLMGQPRHARARSPASIASPASICS